MSEQLRVAFMQRRSISSDTQLYINQQRINDATHAMLQPHLPAPNPGRGLLTVPCLSHVISEETCASELCLARQARPENSMPLEVRKTL